MDEYSNRLRSPHWQRKRLEIMQRDEFKCQFCGDTENTLNVHHVVYLGKRSPWEYEDEHLITICEKCHTDEENLKEEDPFLINMFSMSGLSRRRLYALSAELRRHFLRRENKEEKYQDLMDFLANT